MTKHPALVLVLLAGLGLGTFQFVETQSQGQVQAPVTMPKELTSYRDIVKRVLPAVVSIEAKAKPAKFVAPKAKPRAPQQVPDGLPDEFRKFFEDFKGLPEAPESRLGFGSGFFVDPNGTVLTNFHVVDGADQVTVTLHDGRKFVGKNISGDRRTDLAIVKLDAKGPFPYLEMGDSNDMEIGDRVLAIGAPFGLTGTVTHGIISAKGRSNLNLNMYEDFLQTDAPINPGNSGGPLVGLDAKVVGINSAIKSRSGGFQGIGLAVPSNMAKSIMKALMTDGVVRRGYLGVQIRDLDPEVAVRLGLPKDTGVVVGEVFENTPASKADLQAGDIILQIDGKPIKDGRSLQMSVASLAIGKPTPVNVFREGRNLAINVTVEEQPKEFGASQVPAPRTPRRQQDSVEVSKFGVELSDLNEELADDFGFRKTAQGAVVLKVAPDSAAFEAGLRRGMLISKVDDTKVNGAAQAKTALEAGDLIKGVLLQVQSQTGGINYVLVKTEATTQN